LPIIAESTDPPRIGDAVPLSVVDAEERQLPQVSSFSTASRAAAVKAEPPGKERAKPGFA